MMDISSILTSTMKDKQCSSLCAFLLLEAETEMVMADIMKAVIIFVIVRIEDGQTQKAIPTNIAGMRPDRKW